MHGGSANERTHQDSANSEISIYSAGRTEWLTLCRTILELHRDDLQTRSGYKRLGWQRVRDLIMEKRDDYNGKTLVKRDTTLTRQDVEKFVAGQGLADSKFSLIDRYIRLLDVEGVSDNIRKIIRTKTFQSQIDTLSAIYQQRDISKNTDRIFDDINGHYLYSEDIEGAWYKSMFMKLDFQHESISHVLVAYCPASIRALSREDWPNIIFYEGYLVPFPYRDGGDVHKNGSMMLCTMKLFRPEFRGWRMMGYADGEMRLDYHSRGKLAGRLASVTLDYPNPVVFPALLPHSHKKYYDTPIEEVPSIERYIEDRDKGGKSGHFEHDFLQESRWHISLNFDGRFNEEFDRIIDECYSGYLF